MSTSIVPPELAPTIALRRRLIDAKEVRRILGCSRRHVRRLADQDVLPWGYKSGALRRWDMAEIDAFIAAGCKSCRTALAEFPTYESATATASIWTQQASPYPRCAAELAISKEEGP